MHKIFKYTLQLSDKQEIELPLGAKILSVIEQDDDIQVYALVDPSAATFPFSFYIVGTGNIAPDNIQRLNFLGTVSTRNGSLIWHVFYY